MYIHPLLKQNPMSDKIICKQCQEGIKKWEGITIDSIIEKYQKQTQMTIFDAVVEIIPLIIFLEHHKYCQQVPHH